MHHHHHLIRRSGRLLAALFALALLIAACSDDTVEASAELGQDVALAPSVEGSTNTAEAAAEQADEAETTSVPTTTPIAAPEAPPTTEPTTVTTTTPFVIPTPGETKNQPVFRQARVDNDNRANPLVAALNADGVTDIDGEVSAFTDRVDTHLLVIADGTSDVSINWSCLTYAAEDDRPLRLIIEADDAVLSEFRCTTSGMVGSTTIPVEDVSSLVVVADSNPVEGRSAANMYVQYLLSVRSTPEASSDEDSQPETETEATPEPTPSPEPTTISPEPEATTEPTPTPAPSIPDPTPTPTPEPTAAPTSTPEPEPTSTPEPAPEPTVAPFIPPAEDGPEDEPAIGDGRVAPEDGDSRANPQQPEDAGFLLGSVSGPSGDRSDWSSFDVGPADPTAIFAGVLCENFSGSGSLVVTIYEATTPIAELTCTSGSIEDFANLTVKAGATYFVEAKFIGSGYTDWFFQAGDDD